MWRERPRPGVRRRADPSRQRATVGPLGAGRGTRSGRSNGVPGVIERRSAERPKRAVETKASRDAEDGNKSGGAAVEARAPVGRRQPAEVHASAARGEGPNVTNDPALTFEGKTLLVTGAGRNIGRGIVLEFAARGANVVINVRTNEREASQVEKEAAALGAETLVVVGDVSEVSTVERMCDAATEKFGRVDMYVSNASQRLHTEFWSVTTDDWHRHLNMQLSASWYLAKAFTPGMKAAGWGRVVHVNGGDGWVGDWTRVPHSAAKGGLRALTKSLAEGLGEFGITVNDVVPAYVETSRDTHTHPQFDAAFHREIAERMPIRRLPRVEEVAWACVYLCSPCAGAVTGTALHVDGGLQRLG